MSILHFKGIPRFIGVTVLAGTLLLTACTSAVDSSNKESKPAASVDSQSVQQSSANTDKEVNSVEPVETSTQDVEQQSVEDIVVSDVALKDGGFSRATETSGRVDAPPCEQDTEVFPHGCKTVTATLTNNTDISQEVALGFDVTFEWNDNYGEKQQKTGKLLGAQSKYFLESSSDSAIKEDGYIPYLGVAPKETKRVKIHLSNFAPAETWNDFVLDEAKLLDIKYIGFISKPADGEIYVPTKELDQNAKLIPGDGKHYRIETTVTNNTKDYWDHAYVQYLVEYQGLTAMQELIVNHVAPGMKISIPGDDDHINIFSDGTVYLDIMQTSEAKVTPVFLSYVPDIDKKQAN